MKRALALFGLLGLVGCFLPLTGLSGASLFDFWQLDKSGVALILAAFAIPLVIGGSDKLSTAGAFTAIGCFAYLLLYKFGFDVVDLVLHGSIGGKAISFAALGGFTASLGALAETEA